MIIETDRSYSTYRFKQFIEYIMSDKGRIDENNTFTISHNLKSIDTHEMIQEFVENDQYRKTRKRGVVMYSDTLSFHPDDKDKLSLDILEEIAQKYIELRCKNALCIAKPHIDNKNVHIHFCFSGVEYKSSTTLRINNQQFKSIRIEMEEFQQKFPEIKSSIVYLNKWQKDRLMEQSTDKQSNKEFQLKKRTGKPSQKDLIRVLVHTCYKQSFSKDDFFKRLIAQGLELYKYRNKINGLKDKKGNKHRFSSLSLGNRELALLEKNADRMLELQAIKSEKEISNKKELER